MAERQLGPRVLALVAASLLAMVVALGLADQPVLGAVGPGALRLAWMPLVLWAAAAVADQLDRPRAGTRLTVGARVAVWVVLVALLADHHPNAPDAAAAALHAGVAQVGFAVRTVVATLVGIVVLGGLAAILLSGGSSGSKGDREPRPAAVRTGSSLGPIAAVLLRVAARMTLVIAVTVAWLSLVLVAWTARGVTGVAIALGLREPVATPDLVLARIGAIFGRVGTGMTDLLARRASTWGRQQVHGVWIAPASIERGANGELLAEVVWRETGGETDEVRELRELACGLLAGFDVQLVTGAARMRTEPQGGGDPRNPGPRPYPYRLEVARAWSRPG